ncbi:polysaccharide pyruvyl transferase family protein [Faecalicatena sp. Marseille-Q4148]|nr:polysaccharide pyruvyl transferase family protein [Faecalicatena sp. Marseille-Q4148]
MEKIAVVNRTNLKNYGSVLQCYALCEAIKKMGYESEIIWEQGNVAKNYDFRPQKIFLTAMKMIFHPSLIAGVVKSMKEVKTKSLTEVTVKKFDAFVENHITQKLYSNKELSQIAKRDEYSKFVCGSDQVWCSTTMYVDPLMYLRFAPKDKRIAYAPSIGRNYIPNYNRAKMKKYISEIPYVSIREDDGQRLVKELTGREVPVVLDPTLLLGKKVWKELAYSDIKTKGKYVVLYFLDEASEGNQKRIVEFLNQQGLDSYSIGVKMSYVEKYASVNSSDCGPNDFLNLIQNAEVVITDSYHGMLFSMIFERDFWAIKREYQQYDQSSRQITILKRLGLEERYVNDCSNITKENINYVWVNKILQKMREASIDYLRTALEG